ncbi:ras-related protein Rab-4B-like [Dermatophagoides farinae]|uniref:ras-related protein Rab-4B-like n=1 Tax=Dermatophagoides farinae TaxID=6954 RepID=UPI003F614F01
MNRKKLLILGDASVGKTHLVMSFAKKKLPDKPSATIGIEFETIVVNTKSGKQKSFYIWDTAGQERFRSITKSHFRRALGCFLVYDITERQSYMNIPRWLSDLRQSAPAEIVIILIGNKIDLVDGENLRKVTYEEAQQYANENGLLFFETSAISKQNVSDTLLAMAESIEEKQKNEKFNDNSLTDSSSLDEESFRTEGLITILCTGLTGSSSLEEELSFRTEGLITVLCTGLTGSSSLEGESFWTEGLITVFCTALTGSSSREEESS